MAATLILDSSRFFHNLVNEAVEERKIKTYPQIKSYLAEVMQHYLHTENLYDQQDSSGKRTRKTMTELYLTATQLGAKERVEKLKQLGDSSLYISGFFSDSFQRKIIDIDFYIDMGKMAFQSLAQDVDEDTFSKLFNDISEQFLGLVDVLSLISQKAKMTDEDNILRMMDVYAKTGSSLRGETLAEKGVFNRPDKKNTHQ